MELKVGEEKEEGGNNVLPHLKQAVAAYADMWRRECIIYLVGQISFRFRLPSSRNRGYAY